MQNFKITLFAVFSLAASVCVTQAQIQTLLVRFPLNDTSGGNTFAADTNGQANAITYPGFIMKAFTNNAVAGNFQSSLGEGVSGLGNALDFSTNSFFTDKLTNADGSHLVDEGGAGVFGPIAQVTNSTALNFGFISSFTATIWFKANANMPYTNAGPADGGATGNWDLGPRIFILGPFGTADKNAANTIGLFYQQWNDLAFNIGLNEITLPCFTSPVVPANGNAFVPTNQWLFYAFAYDGNNTVTIYSGTDQGAVTQVLQTSSVTNVLNGGQVAAEGAFVGADALASTPQGIGPGKAGMPTNGIPVPLNLSGSTGPCALFLGNRPGQARPFSGWLNDFRFYSGAATPNQVEDIRWAAVAPVNLAFSLNGLNQPVLTWDALGGAASYIIYTRTNEIGSYVQIGTSSTPTFTDTATATGNTYQYVVAAVDTAGDATTSANSQPITVPLSPAPPPSVPVVTPTAGDNQVTLNWPASTGSGSSAVAVYNIARSTASGQEVVINTVTAPTTTYIDTGLFNGLEYFYTVNAVSVSGSASAFSTEVNSTPVGPPVAPNATAATAGLNIIVRWTDPNPPSVQATDSYIILSSTNNGPYGQLATTGIGVFSFTNTGLTIGNTYSYEVEAVNPGGTSVPSSATASIQVSQQVTLQDIAEQTVRAAADHNGVVNDNGSGTVPGYGAANAVGFLRVKYVNDGSIAGAGTNGVPVGGDQTSCAKTYLRWSLAGQPHPDTNSDLTLTWTTVAAGVPTTMTLWSLNQAYQFLTGVPSPPGDGSSFVPPGSAVSGVTWDNAQANDTNYNAHTLIGSFQMLTSGPFTATPLTTFTATAQNTAPAPVVVIPAPWVNLIHGNELVFCVGGVTNAGSQASAGYRIVNHSPALIYNQVLGVNPPSISPLTNITLDVFQTSSTVTENFTVSDPDKANANGVATGTAAILSDTTGGTSARVSGSGGSQSVIVTPGQTPGVASIEVTITDENGDLAQRTITLTVLPPLVMATIQPTNTLSSTAVAVPFTVVINSAYAQNQLTLNATVDAQSTAVLASAVAAYVSGNTWMVTVTPVAGTNGIGLVDLSVSDPSSFTASAAFPVMVQANQQVVFSDVFNYTSGSSLVLENGSAFGTPPTVNDGIWNEIGPSGPILTVGSPGSLDIAVAGNGEEAFANLLNGPYAPGHGYVIYTTFQGNWSAFSGFTWMGLGAFSGAGGFQYAGVGNVPDAAADGGFNVTILNGPGGAGVSVPETLQPGTTYNIAVRYDVDRASAELWVNATNETDPNGTNVTATDVQAPSQISDITLNQNGAAGNATLTLDDLSVTVVQKPAFGANAVSVAGGNVQIVFTAGVNDTASSFFVTSTTNLTMPFSAINATIVSMGGGVFKATLPVSANLAFYQVARQPFAFSY